MPYKLSDSLCVLKSLDGPPPGVAVLAVGVLAMAIFKTRRDVQLVKKKTTRHLCGIYRSKGPLEILQDWFEALACKFLMWFAEVWILATYEKPKLSELTSHCPKRNDVEVVEKECVGDKPSRRSEDDSHHCNEAFGLNHWFSVLKQTKDVPVNKLHEAYNDTVEKEKKLAKLLDEEQVEIALQTGQCEFWAHILGYARQPPTRTKKTVRFTEGPYPTRLYEKEEKIQPQPLECGEYLAAVGYYEDDWYVRSACMTYNEVVVAIEQLEEAGDIISIRPRGKAPGWNQMSLDIRMVIAQKANFQYGKLAYLLALDVSEFDKGLRP